ncbi:MAG TPA: cytochrome c biogenesis protein CcsA [Thermoanaerobaculia bacterium]|nr:cytochrome c biogenesis protein CcsA [Thermoanaerobaculia bacterium]
MIALYIALLLYAAGTMAALLALFAREKRTRTVGLALMIGGWISHTVWIGTICVRTHHPPLTNLPETASFVGWTVLAAAFVLLARYRVDAASFFVYPLALMLLVLSAVVHEPFARMNPALRSNLFVAHVLLSTVGVAALMVGLAFAVLFWMQDRSLRSKQRGRLWEWIPSLAVCRTLSYRMLAVGFSIYTIGIVTGILWSYRTTSELIDFQIKEVGAVVAWVLFGVLLQSFISGSFRGRKAMVVSACAFVATIVAILGIHHA